jgi:rhombotail lipoprotein
VILYREVLRSKKKVNRWAWGYATLVGATFLPGQQHEVWGYIEASMFDVKTGTMMFTTRRAVQGTRRANVWYQDDKVAALSSKLVGTYAPDLASDLMSDLYRFAAAARLENDRRARVAAGVPEPTLEMPPPAAVAADAP